MGEVRKLVLLILLAIVLIVVLGLRFGTTFPKAPSKARAQAPMHIEPEKPALPPVGDPAQSPLVDSRTPRKIASGFGEISAITADGEGTFYVADLARDQILTCTPEGKTEVFLQPAGCPTALSFDNQGNLLVAASGPHQVWRVSPDGEVSTIGATTPRVPLSGPDSLWVRHDGLVVFSGKALQPAWLPGAKGVARPWEQWFLFYAPGRGELRDSSSIGLIPGAMVGTADGRQLFFVERGAPRTWVTPCKGGGINFIPGARELACPVGADGLCLDSDQNLYTVSDQGLDVWTDSSTRLDHADIPGKALCFGGPDNHLLAVATRTELFTLRATTHGIGPVPRLLKPEEILALDPDRAYAEVMSYLAAGKQSQAERLVAALVKAHPMEPDLAFCHALLTRSRFAVAQAAPLFAKVVNLDEGSPRAKAAALMLRIDANPRRAGLIGDILNTISQFEEDDVLLVWLAAIACRTVDAPMPGCMYYEKVTYHWTPGPVLVHQTYANMLDQTGKLEEAIVHRKIAVELEPQGWSYQGLAVSLGFLKRYDEADRAFAKAAELDPNYLLTWWTWSGMLNAAGRHEEAIEKARHAVALYKGCGEGYWNWAAALSALGKTDEALAVCRKGVINAPTSPWCYLQAADLLDSKGDRASAEKLRSFGKSLQRPDPGAL